MSTQGYKEASKRTAPKKGTLGKALWAFVSGGVMGIIGQGLLTMYQQLLGLDAKAAAGPMVITAAAKDQFTESAAQCSSWRDLF